MVTVRKHSACLIFRADVLPGRLFFVAFGFLFRLWFGSVLFVSRFVTSAFLSMFIAARPFLTWMFGAPFPGRFVSRRLDPAQGAPEIFDFPFVVDVLFFRRFNQFQDVLHLFESVFERFHDSAHLVRGPGE
jgi:hypothetical protein